MTTGSAARQPERVWQVWVRVHLGGERRIDIARAFGYKGGSVITQMLKRLHRTASDNPAIAARMARLGAPLERTLSRIKS